MGVACSTKQGKKIFPSKKSIQLGHRSGQTMNLSTLYDDKDQPIIRRPQNIESIEIIDTQTQLMKVVEPMQLITQILKQNYPNYKIIKVLRSAANMLTAEIQEIKLQNNYIFKRQIYNNFETASKHISYLYNLNIVDQLAVLNFSQLIIGELQNFEDKQNFVGQLYYIDRIMPFNDMTLEDQILAEPQFYNDINNFLQLLQQITQCLATLHKQRFAYRFLRPETRVHSQQPEPLLKYKRKSLIKFLDNFGQQLVQKIVKQEKDYFLYDCVLIGVLVAYLLDQKHSFDTLLLKRLDDDEWDKYFVEEKLTELKQHFQEVPQVIIEIINKLTTSNINQILNMDDMYCMIKNTYQKGMQTNFRNDSLAAYLQYHKNKYISQVNPWIYLCIGNQIHLYNHETEKFHYLKVYRKKKGFQITSQVVYQPDLDNFFFFSHNQSNILLKVYDETHSKPLIFYRREVELFRNFKGLTLENCDIIYVQSNQQVEINTNTEGEMDAEVAPPASFIYIMNNFYEEDPETQTTFFGSYVIYFGYEEEETTKGYSAKIKSKTHEFKRVIKVFEGPRNYIYRQYSYHFYDPHNHLLYCIGDNVNIFAKGIKYQYFDTLLDSGHFKEGVLRFACANKDQYLKFCQFKINIKKISFCIEVQHGVYIMHASKNIFILDFNFRCFYSFASYDQISNFTQNQNSDLLRYQNVYETVNQPFQLQYTREQSKNAVFQEGHILILARKELETVLCVYEPLPNQGQLVLRKCVALYSGQDILSRLPKNIELIIQDNLLLQTEQSKKILKQIETYRCTDLIIQEGNEYFYKAESSQNNKVDQLQQVSNLFKSFTQKVDSLWILNPSRYFTVQENNSQYSMVYVTEEVTHTMKTEIEIRRITGNTFQPKELALIIKVIFKGLSDLQARNLDHGNLSPNALCITKSGIIKLSGWYLTNKNSHNDDLHDAVKLIYSIATLNDFSYQTPLMSRDIEENRYRISQYTGLAEFLLRFLKTSKIKEISSSAFELSQKLTASEINFFELRSNAQSLIWIGYGTNQIIITNISKQEFYKVEVRNQNGHNVQFNKHMCFTYDYVNTIYFTGVILEENMQFQQFYMINTTGTSNQLSEAKKLQDIPCQLYSPTMVYADGIIYLIGGYEINQNLSKSISNRMFNYDTKFNSWRVSPKLPFSLANSTALYSSFERKIYVMGGISDKVEYSSNSFAFLIYDIIKELWEFTIDPSFDSPFANSRFQKPIIDLLNEQYFISYEKRGFFHHLHIFELVKGGLSLKFDILDQDEKQLEQEEQLSQFSMEDYNEYERFLQSELIMAVKQDTVYVMDETSRQLNKFKFTNVLNPTFEYVTCIIRENESQVMLKQATLQPEKFM